MTRLPQGRLSVAVMRAAAEQSNQTKLSIWEDLEKRILEYGEGIYLS
jgi:hypothetical protein